jgi:hypothetical protein
MKDKNANSDGCSIIDHFVGQGASVSDEFRQSEQDAVPGCTFLTEFTGHGEPAQEHSQSAKPSELTRPASQDCDTITTFADQGVPVAEKLNGKGTKRPNLAS